MSESNFPNELDIFGRKVDIQYSDLVNVNQYKLLKLKANRTPEEDDLLNALTITLRDKLFLPQDLNILYSSMENIQNFTKNSIIEYYKFRGNWSAFPNPAYTIFNTVIYESEAYLAIATPGSALPTDESKWQKIGGQGEQGIQGIPGVGLNYRGNFSISTSYVADDLVTWNGNTYYCKSNISGVYPTNETYWGLFMVGSGENLNDLDTQNKSSLVAAINEVKVYIGDSSPPPVANKIWIDTSE